MKHYFGAISPIHTFVNIPALIRKCSVFLSSRAGILTKVLIGDMAQVTEQPVLNSKQKYEDFFCYISPIHTFVNIPALLLKNTLRFLIRAGILTKV